MQLINDNHLEVLKNLLNGSKKKLRIASPFIKMEMAQYIIYQVSSSVDLQLITTLKPDSIINKITDVDALSLLISNHKNINIVINNKLHAKIYIADSSSALITSANLTSKGFNTNSELGSLLSEREKIKEAIEYFNLLYNESIDYVEASKKTKIDLPHKNVNVKFHQNEINKLSNTKYNPKSKKKNRSRQGDILYLDKMGVKIGDKFEDEKGEILEIVSYAKYIKPSKDVPSQPLCKLTLSSALTTSFGEQYDSYHPWVQQEVEKGEKIKTGVLGGGYTREGSREDTWIELRDFEYVGSKLEKDGLNFIVKQGDNEKIISSSEIDKYFKPYIVLSYISKHDSKKIVCELFELMLNKKKKIYHLNSVEKDDI